MRKSNRKANRKSQGNGPMITNRCQKSPIEVRKCPEITKGNPIES